MSRRIRRVVVGAAAIAALGSGVALAPRADAAIINPAIIAHVHLLAGTCDSVLPNINQHLADAITVVIYKIDVVTC